MRAHRAFVARLEPRVVLTGGEFEHLRVLRASLGDVIVVFDGQGLEADATIVAFDETSAALEVGTARTVSLEPPQPITLAVALLKADKLVDVVRAGSELGVARFQLLVTEFCEAREIGAQKLERLRRVALEAAKQCRRAVLPTVLEPVKLTALGPVACGLVAHPGSSLRPREALDWSVPVTVVTGPEGGFSSAEVDLLVGRGFQVVGLGPRILRAETAPLALLGAITAGEGV